MKITFLQNINKKAFIEFNIQSFPERGELNEKLINFRYFNHLNEGDFIKNNIIALDLNDEIIGQALYHPSKYYFEGVIKKMEWSFDLFVRPNKRVDSIGLHLLEFIKGNKPEPIFASGVGEKALKIEKYYGFHVIGFLKKYYKIINPLYIVTGFLQKKTISVGRYPISVGKNEERFNRISMGELWDNQYAYNVELLEFERDLHFLKWRFYSENFEYAVYKQATQKNETKLPLYFVVRTAKIKGISCLMLVDYRYETDSKEDFETILRAAAKIAKSLFLPIMVTASSHKTTDFILESQKFKITGKDRPIICNKKEYKKHKSNIEKRDFIFTTLADSDGEYLM